MQSMSAERRYPLAITAEVAKLNYGELRGWLGRNELLLSINREAGDRTHRRFSPLDILKITITKQLHDCGMSVSDASYAAALLVHDAVVQSRNGIDAIAEALAGRCHAFWKTDGGRWASGWMERPDTVKMVPATFVAIDVGAVAAEVAEKLCTPEKLSRAAQFWLEDITL